MGSTCVPKIMDVFNPLSHLYGVPIGRRRGSALDVLIETILSQNTADKNSGEGFRRLKKRFTNWAAVEKAGRHQVATAIRVSGLSNIKSHRIQEVLRGIRERHKKYTLGFLKKMPAHEAHDYLLSIPGIGRKTAACVLLFGFNIPVFPVDTHIHRAAKRLGLIASNASAEAAHNELQKLVPKAIVYPLHLLMIRHGRETCHAHNPNCSQCVLRSICPFGRKYLNTRNTLGCVGL